MSEEVVGTIVLSIDGTEYDCTLMQPIRSDREPPCSYHEPPASCIKYVAKGNKAYSLSIETVIPLAGSY